MCTQHKTNIKSMMEYIFIPRAGVNKTKKNFFLTELRTGKGAKKCR